VSAKRRCYEAQAVIAAPAQSVFAHADDHARLSGHMAESSWMMAGSRMQIELDDRGGKAVGSRIRLRGRVLGSELAADEVVTEREPALRKMWQTTGEPRLLVIGRYRMGFEVTDLGHESALRVFIEYSLPAMLPARWLGLALGGWYAKWCVDRMLEDAVRYFARDAAQARKHSLRPS
jgi:hypothetical protein